MNAILQADIKRYRKIAALFTLLFFPLKQSHCWELANELFISWIIWSESCVWNHLFNDIIRASSEDIEIVGWKKNVFVMCALNCLFWSRLQTFGISKLGFCVNASIVPMEKVNRKFCERDHFCSIFAISNLHGNRACWLTLNHILSWTKVA